MKSIPISTISIEKKETLDDLDTGSIVIYGVLYDGYNHFVAQKNKDGKWYVGDYIDGFVEVELYPEYLEYCCLVQFEEGPEKIEKDHVCNWSLGNNFSCHSL